VQEWFAGDAEAAGLVCGAFADAARAVERQGQQGDGTPAATPAAAAVTPAAAAPVAAKAPGGAADPGVATPAAAYPPLQQLQLPPGRPDEPSPAAAVAPGGRFSSEGPTDPIGSSGGGRGGGGGGDDDDDGGGGAAAGGGGGGGGGGGSGGAGAGAAAAALRSPCAPPAPLPEGAAWADSMRSVECTWRVR
jgi:hypothetical protein